MHVLYLVPHVPNPTKARSYYHIRGLVEAGHSITVGTLIRGPMDIQHIASLHARGIRVIAKRWPLAHAVTSSLQGYVRGQPLQARVMWISSLARTLESELRNYPADVIHIEHVRMACYGLILRSSFPVVWDAIDHLGSLFQQASRRSRSMLWRLAGWLEAPPLLRYEQWLTGQFPLTLVVSERDRQLFQRDNAWASHVHVALPGLPIEPLDDATPRSDNTLIITGTMDYHPNVTSVIFFVEHILPLIWRERPDVHLQIVGARPARAIRRLADPRITATGFVPSVLDHLRRATVAVAPILYGSGLQNKVIEAFLAGIPVVATTIAAGNLEVSDGRELLIADTPDAIAASVLRLLADPVLRARIAAAGRRYVEQHHDLRVTTRRLVEKYVLAREAFDLERRADQ